MKALLSAIVLVITWFMMEYLTNLQLSGFIGLGIVFISATLIFTAMCEALYIIWKVKK